MNEKWVTYTATNTFYSSSEKGLSELKRELRNDGKKFRTIYYRNDQPTKMVRRKGFVTMTDREVEVIIEKVRPNQKEES